MPVLDLTEVADGTLISAVGAFGRWLAAAVSKPGGRQAEDLLIARWFEIDHFTKTVPEFPGMSEADGQRLARILGGDEIQATLQELLCARLTDAAEAYARGAREAFRLTLVTADSGFAACAEKLADYYDDRISGLVADLEAAEPSALPQIRAEALSSRMIAVLDAIARHTAALAAADTRTEPAFLTSYALHVRDHHGKLQPPDFDRRRLVPIEDIYVPARIFKNVPPVSPDEQPDPLGIDDLGAWLDRTVLLGDPGGGKTTAAKVLMVRMSRRPDRVPFLVTLREYAAADPPERSVVQHITHDLETFYQCPPPPGVVDRLLLTGRGVVIFDGLDELVDTSRRADVTARVERFCMEYPLAPVLVTSRQIGYDEARLDDGQFTTYRLGGFGDDDVRFYVEKWFSHEEDARPGDAGAFLAESANVPDLRSNPLLLALMCILYRGEGSLPRDRASVYAACATLLFRKWDARRRIHAELRAGHLLEPALRHLAWWLTSGAVIGTAMTERDLIAKTAELLQRRGFETIEEARDAAAEFVEFCRGRMWVLTDAGTTAGGERLYAFTHRTFLEYFAASWLAYDSDTPEHLARSLAPHLARNEWSVVAELAVQIKDGTSTEGGRRIYDVLLGEKRRRSLQGRSGVLQFLARTLRSVDPSPAITRELTREILRFLFAGDPDSVICGLPLAWLLASCRSSRNVVSEEIRAWIAEMIASADPAIHMNGLRLATSLAVPLWGRWGEGPSVTGRDPQFEFWSGQMSALTEEYATLIIAAAAQHPEMLYVAVSSGLITLDPAIMIGEGLTLLLQELDRGLFGLRNGSWLLSHLDSLMHDESDAARTLATTSFEAVGKFLVAHPRPPWASQPVSAWYTYGGWVRHTVKELRLSPAAYLGVAATFLISAEVEKGPRIPRPSSNFGPLSDLVPYLKCRHSDWTTSASLPELPVPDEFKELFKGWARREIDFTEPD